MTIFSNPVITSFIGTILGGGIGFYSSRLNNRLNARRLAAANLHAVFQPILFKILCQEIALGDEIRRESSNIFATQILELGRYRFYVSESDIAAYDDACKKYYLLNISHTPAAATDTQGLSSDAERYNSIVNAILHFAKP